jgi:hypothetical protein
MHLFPMLAAGSLLLTVAALADEPSVRKAGEWQVTTIGPDGNANPPKSYCYGQASITDLMKSMGVCSKRDISTIGNTTTVDAICTKGTQQVTAHMTITAASDTSRHAESQFTYLPPVAGMGHIDIVSDSKWLGPCPAGEKPVN